MQDHLESQTEYILKETKALFKNPAILWAGGKDSTTLLYITKMIFGKVPFPVIFLETGFKFRETYEFLERIEKAWDLNLIRAKNMQAILRLTSPEKDGRFLCCNLLKTENLKKIIIKNKFDAVIVAIRWSEQGIRGKEDFFSIRKDPPHYRVHPLLDWSEQNIWTYIKKHNIPYNPLYDRKIGNKFYRSIGCYPCTKPTDRKLNEERSGRAQDKEEIMEQLRALGYM